MKDDKDKKPRIRWCWECGRQLRGNKHVDVFVQGHKRILHIDCWENIKCSEKQL